MSEKLIDAFEICLQDIKDGATVNECMKKFPQYADELRPSLEAAVAAHRLGSIDIPAEVIQRSRTQMLAHAARLRSEKSEGRPSFRFPLIAFSALMLALVLILGSRELIVVSAESLPGDSLYPIKRVVQDFRVQLAPNLETKHEIETLYRNQRIEEIQDLLTAGRIEMVSFEGVVNRMAPQEWDVGGIPVVLSENTVVIGEISPGALVEVEGSTSTSGWIIAHELHKKEFEFMGQVEEIDFDVWVISGLEFEMTTSTQIYSSAQVGDQVLVLARIRDNGSQYAMAIIRLPSYIKNPEIARNDPSVLIAGKEAGDEIELSGTVEFISSTYWVVDSYAFSISLFTEVDHDIGIGDYVTVHAIIREGGTLWASVINSEAYQTGDDDGEESGDVDSDDREQDGDADQQDDHDRSDDDDQDDSNEVDEDYGDEGEDSEDVKDDHNDDSEDGNNDNDKDNSDDDSADDSDNGPDDGGDEDSDDDAEETEEPEEPED